MYKDKHLIINILIALWELPQILIGLIILAIFHNKTTYTNPCNHISVWNINAHGAFGTACFSLGPIIVTCNDKVAERTLRHETGHSYDGIRFGLLYFFIVAIPSVFLFWYKRIFSKSQEWYLQRWPEVSAEKRGMTTINIETIKNE